MSGSTQRWPNRRKSQRSPIRIRPSEDGDSATCYEFGTKSFRGGPFGADSGILLLEDSTATLSVKKTAPRSGTRVPCEISVTLSSLDPVHPFSEPCEVILVNLRGCAARFTRAVAIGTAVELQGLPTNSRVTGRTVNCISLGEHGNVWLLGVELDEPGNVWGIQAMPADWLSAP